VRVGGHSAGPDFEPPSPYVVDHRLDVGIRVLIDDAHRHPEPTELDPAHQEVELP